MNAKLFFVIVTLLLVPSFLWAATCTPGSVDTKLCDPTGAGSIEGLITRILATVGTMVGTVAMIMIVYSGFQMLIASGDAERLKKGKDGFKWAVIGFVISILSFVIVAATLNFFGAGKVGEGDLDTPTGIVKLIADKDFFTFIKDLLNGFLSLVGILAVLLIIINGIRYVTARGDDEASKKAKDGLTWSVVGFVSILIAYVIITASYRLFGGTG